MADTTQIEIKQKTKNGLVKIHPITDASAVQTTNSTTIQQELDNAVPLVAGDNITIAPTDNGLVISAQGGDLSKYVPITRTINGKALSSDITLAAADVGVNETNFPGLKETGTVTSVAVKMNNAVKGTITSSGTIDLGTVLTSHQSLTNYVTTNTTQTITGLKTFNAPTNSNGTEQTTLKVKTANGGAILLGKEGPNSGTMIRLDQTDGTTRLQFRASATAGAMVWRQPEKGAALYFDLGDSSGNIRRTTLSPREGTIALISDLKSYVPTSRTINGKALTGNITLAASDVGVTETAFPGLKKTGTVTSVAVKMNGSTKGTITSSGTIDLGTVITSHQSLANYVTSSSLATTLSDYAQLSTENHFDGPNTFQDGLYVSDGDYKTSYEANGVYVEYTPDPNLASYYLKYPTWPDPGGKSSPVYFAYAGTNDDAYLGNYAKQSDLSKFPTIDTPGGLRYDGWNAQQLLGEAAAGYTGDTVQYILLATMPESDGSSWSSVLIKGRIGGWGADSVNVDIRVQGRDGPQIIGTIQGMYPGNINNGLNTCDIAVNQNTDKTFSIWLCVKGYYSYALDIRGFGPNSLVKWTGATVSSRDGTEKTRLSTSTYVNKIIGNGLNILVNDGKINFLDSDATNIFQMWGSTKFGRLCIKNVEDDKNDTGLVFYSNATNDYSNVAQFLYNYKGDSLLGTKSFDTWGTYKINGESMCNYRKLTFSFSMSGSGSGGGSGTAYGLYVNNILVKIVGDFSMNISGSPSVTVTISWDRSQPTDWHMLNHFMYTGTSGLGQTTKITTTTAFNLSVNLGTMSSGTRYFVVL